MTQQVDEALIAAQFKESLKGSGITPRVDFEPIIDGRIHRFDIDGHHIGNLAGCYCCYPDKVPNWWIKDFYIHNTAQKFTFDFSAVKEREWVDPETWKAQKIAEAKAIREREEKRKADNIQKKADRAAAILKAKQEYDCSDCLDWEYDISHPYLTHKGFNIEDLCGFELRVKLSFNDGDHCRPGTLLAALHSVEGGEFSGLQRIFSDKEGNYLKRFYPGTSIEGCNFQIFPPISLVDPHEAALCALLRKEQDCRLALLTAGDYYTNGLSGVLDAIFASPISWRIAYQLLYEDTDEMVNIWRTLNEWEKLEVINRGEVLLSTWNVPVETQFLSLCTDLKNNAQARILLPQLHSDTLYIAEGIATAFSVYFINNKRYPVVAALSCSNLPHVASAWRKRQPSLRIVIAADNDKPGLEAAKKCIENGYADSFIAPPIEGFDWNDYYNGKEFNS